MRYRQAFLGILILCVVLIVGSLIPGMPRVLSKSDETGSSRPASAGARLEERYYMIIFACQGDGNQPRSSHTFATFVKASKDGSAQDDRIDAQTISWLPVSLEVAVLRRRPEPGRNFNLEDTLRWAESIGARVSRWGPYEIEKGLYDRALRQKARLESGAILFKCIDENFRPATASNCIHAVSDMDKSQPELNSGTAHGDEATKMVLSFFDPYILPIKGSNRWLVDRLGPHSALDELPAKRYVFFADDAGRGWARVEWVDTSENQY